LYRIARIRASGIAFIAINAALAVLAMPAAAQQTPPGELVRVAIQNEVKDDSHSHLFTWKERKYTGRENQVENIVDTPAGVVSRVVLIDDKPLTATQRSQEEQRLRKMLDPEQMRRKKKDQQEDDERTRRMLSAIPDAFDFMYLGSVQGPNGHKLDRIKFSARSGFNPPNRESMVFSGMSGEMLVDETAHRLAKIDGTLFKEVNFGWGVLGKLYKGGRFLVEQSEVAPGHWDTTKMYLHFDGKILVFKSLHIEDNETSWAYQPVPPMSVEQALDFLNHEAQPPQNAQLRR
jgi:hypothetical protein